jgi:hypothetical protein
MFYMQNYASCSALALQMIILFQFTQHSKDRRKLMYIMHADTDIAVSRAVIRNGVFLHCFMLSCSLILGLNMPVKQLNAIVRNDRLISPPVSYIKHVFSQIKGGRLLTSDLKRRVEPGKSLLASRVAVFTNSGVWCESGKKFSDLDFLKEGNFFRVGRFDIQFRDDCTVTEAVLIETVAKRHQQPMAPFAT